MTATWKRVGSTQERKNISDIIVLVALQAWKMEVAGGYLDYPQVNDTGIEGKVEMQ